MWLSSSSLSTAGWLAFSFHGPMGLFCGKILRNWFSGAWQRDRKRTNPTCITLINLRSLDFWLCELWFWCLVLRHFIALHCYVCMTVWCTFLLERGGERKCIPGWKIRKKGKKTRFNNGQPCSCNPLVLTWRSWAVVLGNQNRRCLMLYSTTCF